MFKLSWTKEDHLLLNFCQTDNDDENRTGILNTLRGNINWDSFLKKARENGISAIVYSNLNQNKKSFPTTPSIIYEELKKDYYQNANKNTLIFKELEKILEILRQVRIQVIVLKGAALAETVYRNIALRPMSDIDILVKKEDLLRIDEQLKSLGYFPFDRTVNDIDFSSTYLTTLEYRSSAKNSFTFHVHWHFVNSTIPAESYINCIKIEDIWEDAEKAKIANMETLVMAPHHLIIHLSEHALRVMHSFNKYIYFCDIDVAINFYKEELDWDKLIKDSFEFNLNRMVYLSLYFTSKFLGTKIPKNVLMKLKPEKFSVGEKYFINSISNNNRFPGLSYLVHFSMNKGLFKKMKFMGRTLFPPRQILAQRNYIPVSKLSCIHYFRRINEVFSHLPKILK